MDNIVVLDELITDNYFHDTLDIPLDSIRDISLTFNFYTAQDHRIRTETIQLLASRTPCQLPQISIEVTPQPSKGDHTLQATFGIINTGPLQTDYVLDYVFYNHVGWDYGVAATANLSHENPIHTQNYNYSSNVDVITLGAGINATYGSFSKRITHQKVYILGDTSHIELPSGFRHEKAVPTDMMIYPNPAADFIHIDEDIQGGAGYQIINAYGRILLEGKLTGNREISILCLPEGIYLLICRTVQGELRHSAFIKAD